MLLLCILVDVAVVFQTVRIFGLPTFEIVRIFQMLMWLFQLNSGATRVCCLCINDPGQLVQVTGTEMINNTTPGAHGMEDNTTHSPMRCLISPCWWIGSSHVRRQRVLTYSSGFCEVIRKVHLESRTYVLMLLLCHKVTSPEFNSAELLLLCRAGSLRPSSPSHLSIFAPGGYIHGGVVLYSVLHSRCWIELIPAAAMQRRGTKRRRGAFFFKCCS